MVFVGEVYESYILVGNDLILAKMDPETTLKEGDQVTFGMRPEHCLLVSR